MAPIIEDSNRFGAATEQDVCAFETSLGVRLPEDYRRFLLKHNGGRPRPATFRIGAAEGESRVHLFLGLHDGPSWASLRRDVETLRHRIPRNTIPIGDDPFGNSLLLVLQGSRRGELCFWDHECEGGPSTWDNVTPVAASFTAFLESLKEFEEPPELQDDEVTRRIAAGDIAWLEKLLDSGVSPDAKNKFDHKLADVAAVQDRPDVLKLLCRRGAELSGALRMATQNGNLDAARALLDLGVDVDDRSSPDGVTALMNAAAFGHDETVRLLLSKGANVRAKDSKGRSALQLASWGEHREIIRMLKAAGA